MDILDRIVALLNGRNQKDLCDYLKLDKSAVTAWKNGSSKSYQKYLVEIARFFNVSIDYLVYGKETLPIAQLSADEQKLLEDYNDLHDPEKKLALQFISNLLLAQSPAEPDADDDTILPTAAISEQEKTVCIINCSTGKKILCYRGGRHRKKRER